MRLHPNSTVTFATSTQEQQQEKQRNFWRKRKRAAEKSEHKQQANKFKM